MVESFLKELNDLVTIDCGSKNIVGVNKIADIITTHFDAMNTEAIPVWTKNRQSIDEKCGDLLTFCNKPDAERYDVTIFCHMDTVYAAGICAKYPPYQDGDKYCGPGVADMKAGCLGAIYALRQLDKTTLNALSICIAFTPDEELGSPYSFESVQKLAKKSDRVIITEAARINGDMLNARKGNGKIKLEFFGKAAHAANALEDGISAITEFAHWVPEINKLVNFEKGTTVSIGTVEGGTGTNVVPEYVKAIMDHRFLTNEEGTATFTHLQQMAEKPFLEGASVKVTHLTGRPAFEVQPGADSFQNLVDQQAKALDIHLNWITGNGGSDGNITASLGVPTLDGFGPCGAGFHNVEEEHILISSIEPRILLLQRTLEALGRQILLANPDILKTKSTKKNFWSALFSK